MGGDGTDPGTFTSTDGINWTFTLSGIPAVNESSNLAWAPELGYMVAVGFGSSGDRIYVSSDGLSWSPRAVPYNMNTSLLGIAWSPERGVFVIPTMDATTNILTSMFYP